MDGDNYLMKSFIIYTVNVILLRVIKWKIIICVGPVARIRKMRNAYRILEGNFEERNHVGEPVVWIVFLYKNVW